MRTMNNRFRLFALWILQSWVMVTHAASLRFLYPDNDGMTFYYENTIAVKYESNFSNPLLYTFCRIGSGDPFQHYVNYTSPYNATALITLAFTTGSQCWFNLRSDDSSDGQAQGFNSYNWNYKVDAVNQTTVGFTTVSATTSPTTSATTSASTASTTTSSTSGTAASSTTSSSQPTGLSTGAKAGIGVGIGIAAIAGITAIVALMLRQRRKKQASQVEPQQHAYIPSSEQPSGGSPAPTGISTQHTASDRATPAHYVSYDEHAHKFGQAGPTFTVAPQMQELDSTARSVHELPAH